MMHKSVLSLFAVAVSFAQPPASGLKVYMNLTDSQLASITAANRAAMDANRTIADQMHSKMEALHALLNSGSTDAAAIGRAMLETQALRKQMDAARAKSREQAVSFLTADQKTKLKSLQDAESLHDEIREAHALQLLAASADGPGPRRGANFIR